MINYYSIYNFLFSLTPHHNNGGGGGALRKAPPPHKDKKCSQHGEKSSRKTLIKR